MAVREVAIALAAFGATAQASGADLQLMQASFGPGRTETEELAWLSAELIAENGQCAASVGNGYCDLSQMTYGTGKSCNGQYCGGLTSIQQCCDVVAAMPECKSAPHIGFIPSHDSESTSACGCCGAFVENTRYMAEFYRVETDTRAADTGKGTTSSGVGDPHLQNIYGQRFDLMQPGTHTLLRIPKGTADLLLDVSAKVRQVGSMCSDMYFKELNITGRWADSLQAGGFQFRASEGKCDGESWKASLGDGKLDLKVAHGCTSQGARYLNIYVKHLGRVGMSVGGLLGEDDHTAEATPQEQCKKLLTLSSDFDETAEGGPLGPNGPTRQ